MNKTTVKTRGYSDATKEMLMEYSRCAFARFIQNIRALPPEQRKQGHDEFLEGIQSAIALGQITFQHNYNGPKKKYEIVAYSFGYPVGPFDVSVYKLKKFWKDKQAHETK